MASAVGSAGVDRVAAGDMAIGVGVVGAGWGRRAARLEEWGGVRVPPVSNYEKEASRRDSANSILAEIVWIVSQNWLPNYTH